MTVCPVCESDLEPVGYSMFSIVLACAGCSFEKDIERTRDNEHVVQELKDRSYG